MGPEGFGDFLDKLNDAFSSINATPAKVLGADDNHVIVVARIKARAKGGGATVEHTDAWVYQLRDGKIADTENFVDTAAVLDALG